MTDYSSDLDELVIATKLNQITAEEAKAKLEALLRRVEVEHGASEKPQSGNKPSGKQVDTLLLAYDEIVKLAVVTLDPEPVNKALNIPVGKFVRLDDVKSVLLKYKEKL